MIPASTQHANNALRKQASYATGKKRHERNKRPRPQTKQRKPERPTPGSQPQARRAEAGRNEQQRKAPQERNKRTRNQRTRNSRTTTKRKKQAPPNRSTHQTASKPPATNENKKKLNITTSRFKDEQNTHTTKANKQKAQTG